ncbi:MAG: hypothetical protein KF767_17230 [Bdellovibrionaceae bacterium]|nr:hypothetical protein [Pseudobdellovibrionaceae bacterium]
MKSTIAALLTLSFLAFNPTTQAFAASKITKPITTPVVKTPIVVQPKGSVIKTSAGQFTAPCTLTAQQITELKRLPFNLGPTVAIAMCADLKRLTAVPTRASCQAAYNQAKKDIEQSHPGLVKILGASLAGTLRLNALKTQLALYEACLKKAKN